MGMKSSISHGEAFEKDRLHDGRKRVPVKFFDFCLLLAGIEWQANLETKRWKTRMNNQSY